MRYINQGIQYKYVSYICQRFAFVLLISGLMYILSSCDRETDTPCVVGAEVPTGEPVTVNFTMMEIQASPSPSLMRGVEETNTYPSSSVIARHEAISPSPMGGDGGGLIPIADDLFMQVILQEEVDPEVTLRAGSSRLNAGVKVRVVAYSYSSSDLDYTIKAAHTDFEVDAAGNLIPDGMPPMVIPSAQYKFVAYSYNDAVLLPAFADTTASIGSRDLLWAETIETVTPEHSTVSIILEHKFSLITLRVSVDPAVGTHIDNIDHARFEHIRPELAVRTGSLTNAVLSDTVPFTWNTYSGSAPIVYSDSSQVFTNGGSTLYVEIDRVTIGRSSAPDTLYSSPGPDPWQINYTLPPGGLTPGKKYTLLVNFLPPPTPEVTDFTVSASGAATQAATSSNFTLNVFWDPSSAQTITLTGLVTGTNVTDITNWTRGGANAAWGATPGDSKNYLVTIPANTIGSMTVTAKAVDDPTRIIVITINCVNFRLFYNEGNATYGSTTPYVPTNAVTGTTTANRSLTINLTSPIISGGMGYQGTVRHFSTYYATTTTISNQIWTISQTGVGAALYTGNLTDTPTAYNGAAVSTVGLLIPNGYVGVITLTCSDVYTVTVIVTNNRARSSAVEVGETFAEAGVEWRVLAKGTGVNGANTGAAANALIIAEHVQFSQAIVTGGGLGWSWAASELRDQLQGGGNATGTARIWYDNLGTTFTNSIVPTTIWTRTTWNGSTYTSLAAQQFFLLSEEELYRTGQYPANMDLSRNLYPALSLFATTHARKATIIVAPPSNYGTYWFSRTPYSSDSHVAIVNRIIGTNESGRGPFVAYSVRPACVINLY